MHKVHILWKNIQLYSGLTIFFALTFITFLIIPNNSFVTASDKQAYIFEALYFLTEIYHLTVMICNLFQIDLE